MKRCVSFLVSISHARTNAIAQADAIRKLQGLKSENGKYNRHVVAMVGDGINDAPVNKYDARIFLQSATLDVSSPIQGPVGR